MTSSDIFNFFQTFGVPLCLVVFFIWQDHKREQRMIARINEVEDYQKTRLESLVIESQSLLKESNKLIAENTRVMQEVCFYIGEKIKKG